MWIKIQPDASVCRYLFTAKLFYMFRVSRHPSSGVLKTVTAASGTGTATSLQRGPIGTGLCKSRLAQTSPYLNTAKLLYMFRVSQHQSSGVLKTVTAASGTGHNTGAVTSLQRGPIGPRWRRCATYRKVAGSIPDGVGIFHWHNPSDRTMALGSTQPLTEMSTRSISWG